MTPKAIGLGVTEACHEMWRGLTTQEQEEAAAALDVSRVTIYQWGETRENGDPRCKIPARKVARFCAACRSTLLLDVLVHQTKAAMRGVPTHQRQYTQPETMRECVDIAAILSAALEDGKLTDQERADVMRETREFLAALADCEMGGNGRVRYQRARTLAEAERSA